MEVYTAETNAGDIWVIAADVSMTAAKFQEHVIALLNWHADEDTPQQLTLYCWPSEDIAAVWIAGETPLPGESWPSMGRRAEFGEVSWQFPGQWEFKQTASARHA